MIGILTFELMCKGAHRIICRNGIGEERKTELNRQILSRWHTNRFELDEEIYNA